MNNFNVLLFISATNHVIIYATLVKIKFIIEIVWTIYFNRIYKLLNAGTVEVIPFTVPRKVSKIPFKRWS